MFTKLWDKLNGFSHIDATVNPKLRLYNNLRSIIALALMIGIMLPILVIPVLTTGFLVWTVCFHTVISAGLLCYNRFKLITQ